MPKRDATTIWIKPATKNMLDAAGFRGESYDDINKTDS